MSDSGIRYALLSWGDRQSVTDCLRFADENRAQIATS
jgi:hypothetical protein